MQIDIIILDDRPVRFIIAVPPGFCGQKVLKLRPINLKIATKKRKNCDNFEVILKLINLL